MYEVIFLILVLIGGWSWIGYGIWKYGRETVSWVTDFKY